MVPAQVPAVDVKPEMAGPVAVKSEPTGAGWAGDGRWLTNGTAAATAFLSAHQIARVGDGGGGVGNLAGAVDVKPEVSPPPGARVGVGGTQGGHGEDFPLWTCMGLREAEEQRLQGAGREEKR